jgi:hypothetical protein
MGQPLLACRDDGKYPHTLNGVGLWTAVRGEDWRQLNG